MKKKKIVLLTVLVILVVVGGAVGFAAVNYIIPSVKYKNAEIALQNGEYEAAIAEFKELGNYKDSRGKVKRARYKQAEYLAENGEYDEAIDIFNDLDDFDDSNSRIKDVTLMKAESLIENGEYKSGLDLLNSVMDLEGAKALADRANYELALQDLEHGEYASALANLNGISDKTEEIKEKISDAQYGYGKKLIESKDFDKAEEMLKNVYNKSKYEDAEQLYYQALYETGVAALEKKNYKEGISKLEKVKNREDFSDVKSLITEAKYNYVTSHKSNTDQTTYDYLKELKSAGYADTSAIYSDLYKWYITDIVVNNSESDTITDMSSVSKNQTAYFHFTLKGGAPGETAKLTSSDYYSSGESNSYSWEGEWYTNSDMWHSAWWEYPSRASSTTLTVTIYVNGSAVGSKSVARP